MSKALFSDRILPLREQMTVYNTWLRERLDTILPALMQRENFDMWLVIAREYNEDPVIMTLLPQPEMAARRRTILAFVRTDEGTVERYTLSRYPYDGFYQSAWNPDEEDQYEALRRLIRTHDPQRIGINISEEFAFGDGITHLLHEQLRQALGEASFARTYSAERLCIGWLETRTANELMAYPQIVSLGHAIIARAFSTEVIHPGITTTEDVVWWMRQTMHDLGLEAWFQPTIAIQAPGLRYDQSYAEVSKGRTRIQPGDLLHCDMGFYYLGLATDQQQHAYVLRPGETSAPESLQQALAQGNRLQDLHMEAMQTGRTGNEILHQVRQQALEEGLRPSVYSHPIGTHGHAAGPTIGLWDQQGGVPGRGDYPVYDNTCYSIELNIVHDVPEWGGQEVRIALEEDAIFSDGRAQWMNGRQQAFHLVG